MIDFPSLLYDPVYVALGVPAVLTLNDSAGTTANITVIDATSGIASDERGPGGAFGLQTIRPVAYVRATELNTNAITPYELEDASIVFNANTWRIESHQPKPSPGGEAAGEIMLILIMTALPAPPAMTYVSEDDETYYVTENP
jgi:hypothetical protein